MPILSAIDYMKKTRISLIATVIALLVVLAFSLSVFGAEGGEVTPVNGVYEIATKDQLVWVFNEIQSGTVAANVSIKLVDDIDVAGELPTLTTTFTGTFDGNGKTVSGLTRTIFKQFNGKAYDLTMRGTINKPYSDNDSARKTASFSMNSGNGTVLTNLISYVDITSAASDTNAGGIVGYCNAVTFIGCEYYGTYTLEWKGSNAGFGGIVGWCNAGGNAALFDDCHFGGTLKLTGSSGGKAYFGGVVGNIANASVTIQNCTSDGNVLCTASSAADYVGGIAGINANVANKFENNSNRSTVTAITNAGGIIGGSVANITIASSTNFGTVTATNAGEFCGNGKDNNGNDISVTIKNSYDFSEKNNDLCATTYINNGSYRSNEVSSINTFTIGDVEYERYTVCVVEKESGILMPLLATDKMFEAYLSIREDGLIHAVRFVIVATISELPESATVNISFKDDFGVVVKTFTGKLTMEEDSDFELYASVTAGGEKYFAANENALFGCVINNIPTGAWAGLEVTIKDSETEEEYMAPCTYEIHNIMTLESLPDYTSLGTVSGIYNCGPGLMSDKNGITEEDSYMVVISSTTAEKLVEYTEMLPTYGYRLISQNTLDGDTYYTYLKAGALLYLYHSSKVKETRIIADNSSTLLSKINYEYTKEEGDTTEFYQYSINYTSVDKEDYDPVTYTEASSLDCGMMYIIKLPDNKIVMIDGGHRAQVSAKARAELLKFLRQITGKSENEKVDIAMWYFTHAHGDHVSAASDFIAEYHDKINLESVAFNFPSYQVLSDNYDDNTFTLKQNINTYFPEVPFHKLHTGEVVSLAGVTFEVIYTHEDAVAAASSGWLGGSKPGGTTEISSFNDSSTVVRITMDGKTIMMLGDVDSKAQTVINAFHNSSYLKTDVVQAAHHGYNNVSTLYGYIKAEIGLFPNSMYSAKEADTSWFTGNAYSQIMKYATEEYFAHKYTYKFVVEDGKFVSTALPRYDQQ